MREYKSSIIMMTRSRKNIPIIEIPIIEFTYNGILKILVLRGCISKKIAVIEEWIFFINPGIERITIIEVPIIEDLLYCNIMKSIFLLDTSNTSGST